MAKSKKTIEYDTRKKQFGADVALVRGGKAVAAVMAKKWDDIGQGFHGDAFRALDPDAIPAFLVRKRVGTPLPAKEDMQTAPVIKRDVPLALAADGMNIIETSLHAGTNDETGLHRFLIVRSGTKNAELLQVSTLEHHQVDVRYINDRIASGRSHYYALPMNLGQRIIDKTVQWEMHGMRYSRSLVNEALTNLGYPPLAMPNEVAGSTVASEKRARAKGDKGPGVIDRIIEVLQGGGGTVDELLAKLLVWFPDRGEGMRGTIKTQLNRLPKQGRLEIVKTGGRYAAKGATPATAQTPAAHTLPAAQPGTKASYVEELRKQEANEAEYSAQPLGTLPKAKTKATIRSVAAKKAAKTKAKKGKK